MKKIPSVLSIQDFCSIGRCSLAATIPVLSTCGVQPIPLPTSLFSSTPFFDHYDYLEVQETNHKFLEDWHKNGFKFDAIQTGFLAEASHVEIIKDAIERFANEDTFIVVDPAMADEGKLYAHFTQTTVDSMRELITYANLISPNYTEALLLTNNEYSDEPISLERTQELCQELAKKGPSKVIITSIPTSNDIIRTALYDAIADEFTIMDTPHIPVYAPGTGDIFTAIVTANTLHGEPLVEGVRRAVDFIYEAIKYTVEQNVDTGFGVLLEHMLPKLLEINPSYKKQ